MKVKFYSNIINSFNIQHVLLLLQRLLNKRLTSKECQNHGFIIDGYPKTLAQAQRLFDSLTKKNNNEQINIMPELVIILEANDEYLFERVIHLPEHEIQRTNHNLEPMLRRLREYRRRFNEENKNNLLEFFIANKIQLFIISIENCLGIDSLFFQCLEVIGKPRSLRPINLEINTTNLTTTDDKINTHVPSVGSEIKREEKFFQKQQEHNKMMIDWVNNLEKIFHEEEINLQQLSEPLRLYLVNYVFSTLTQGLVEVEKLRPDDPVDFLVSVVFNLIY
ncbi:hypothetical protein PV327_001574 [Microctonus hyperodae]|uniref:Adenylate kinase n=1 Tax=Microctonus hyperodae TaxID=165561 RepID=A0AA39L3H8_MICHY|nr:hypothetical protein PV327_001574 [Microctonus hyperodae]